MGVKKQPYELSVWEDVVNNNTEEGSFSERKLAVIGSHDNKSPARAFNVKVEERVSGEKILTFDLLRKIRDENDKLIDNPFLGVLVNEAKIKLRDGEEYNFFSTVNGEERYNPGLKSAIDDDERWTDYVLKNKNEDRNGMILHFTAHEMHVNELGKNGWAVILNTELENNYGTLKELSDTVLSGSGWETIVNGRLTEKSTEVILKATLAAPLSVTNISTGQSKELAFGDTVYIFYPFVKYENGWKVDSANEYQVLYKGLGQTFSLSDLNEEGVVNDEGEKYNYTTRNKPSLTNIELNPVGGEYLRAKRIVKSANTRFDNNVERYVQEYKISQAGVGPTGLPPNKIVYGFNQTEFPTASVAKNMLTNTTGFRSIYGWGPQVTSGSTQPPRVKALPITGTEEPTSYLQLPITTNVHRYYNEGPSNSRVTVTKGEGVVVRWKARIIQRNAKDYNGTISVISQPRVTVDLGYETSSGWQSVTNSGSMSLSSAQINQVGEDKGYGIKGSRVPFNGIASSPRVDESGYAYIYLVPNTSTNSVLHKLQLRITTPTSSSNGDLYIADIQAFEYKEDSQGKPIFLGDIPNETARVKQNYFYYNELDDLEYLPSNDNYYVPLYKDNFEQVRHVELKESNYFNNVNELAELFKTWIKFKTFHTRDGRIYFENGKPKKQVIYTEYSGVATSDSGFKYGINLENIVRDTDSMSIASKIIVKNNNQKFAKDGTASIARAKSNPSGETEIINFDYYINQGLIDRNEVIADLYGMSSRDLGLYPRLKNLNAIYQNADQSTGQYKLEVSINEAKTEAMEVVTQELQEALWTTTANYESTPADDVARRTGLKEAITQISAQLNSAKTELLSAKRNRDHYARLLKQNKEKTKDILAQKKELKDKFYTKYARYLQEGTWIDEQYTDDEMYYLDALKVAQDSAFPQVSYTIDVIDVSVKEEFEGYKYRLGDTTYVEDTEFFGWVYKNPGGVGATKTPYQKEVVVTTKIRHFDDPTQYQLIVQNYKSRFEELFQKMASTSTTLQYNEGQYLKPSTIINQDGTINLSTIEQAMANNSFVLGNSLNQSVTWDSGRGIEITDTSNSSLITRLVAGGLFISTNGGRTWTAGVTGEGINTKLLTAGVIDTEIINLITNGSLAFRWDGNGITSFYNGDDETADYSASQFVRYNQYGIFGTTTGTSLNNAVAEAETFNDKLAAIKENANWSLTWDGIYMKNPNGGISLDPIGGFQVFNPNWQFTEPVVNDGSAKPYDPVGPRRYEVGDDIPLISLGKQYDDLGTAAHYGMRMRNKEGYLTLVTDNDGNLWAKNSFELGQKDLVSVEITQEDENGEVTINTEEYHRYIHFNGTPSLDKPYIESPMIAVGDTDIKQAPFRVYGDGYTIMNDADVTGTFHVERAEILGNINIGNMAGINGYPNFDESEIAHTFWSGKKDDSEPTFYVRPDGFLYAEEAYINGQGTFRGDIYADNGYFKGEVAATSGSIEGKIYFGDTENNSYIGSDEELFININNGSFGVSNNGDIYGDILRLNKNKNWNGANYENYNIIIGENDNVIKIYDPSTGIENKKVVFGVDEEGNVQISGKLNTHGDLTFGGALLSADKNMRIDGERGSIEVNTPGTNGWGIYSNGDAYFDNITARGKISATVFERKHVSSVGGRLLVSPSLVLQEDTVGIDTDDNLSFTMSDSGFTEAWEYVNKVLININNTEVSGTYDYNTEKITISKTELETVPDVGDTLPKGTIVISTSTAVNSVLLDATDPMGGYVKIEGPEDDEDRSTVLLGNLKDSLIPTKYKEFFGYNLGYGLYADNAYLTGKMYLPQAGITNDDIYYGEEKEGNQIRFFAGETPQNMQNAPFIVTQDGSMYSSKGTFSGNVMAENSIFNGYIIGSGVMLDEDLGNDFFFSRNWGNKEEPSYKDMVMNISDKSVDVWGQLKIFSKYYEEQQKPHYTGKKAFPIFSAIDENASGGFVPRIVTTDQHIWRVDSDSDTTNKADVSSVKIQSGKISFTDMSLSTPSVMGHEGIDAALWSNDSKLSIGKTRTGYGLTGREIEFTDTENIAMKVIPKTDINNNRRNISETKIYSHLNLGDKVRTEETNNGIVFTYIGE